MLVITGYNTLMVSEHVNNVIMVYVMVADKIDKIRFLSNPQLKSLPFLHTHDPYSMVSSIPYQWYRLYDN